MTKPLRTRATVVGMNAKTRMRIVTGVLVVLFLVVVLASALGGR